MYKFNRNYLKTARKPVLLSVATLFWVSMYTYPAILSPYLVELGASMTFIGFVISSYGLAQLIIRLPVGILSDRLHNKRLFIIIGIALSFISATGLYLFHQVGLILLFRALAGAAAAMWVHITTLYLSYHSSAESAEAMGKMSFGNNFGMMIAILSGSFLADKYGWESAFFLAALVAGIALILSFTVQEDQPDPTNSIDPPPGLNELLQLRHDRMLLWTSILALLSQIVIYATVQGFVPQYAELLGASKSDIGMLTALSILPRAVAGLLGGIFLARWFNLKTLIFIGFLLVGFATCSLPLINNLPGLYVCQFVAGIGIGLQAALLLALATQTVANNRKASAMGIYQAIYGIGMVIGPTLIGFVADIFDLKTGFVLVGIISLIGAFLVLIFLENQPSKRSFTAQRAAD